MTRFIATATAAFAAMTLIAAPAMASDPDTAAPAAKEQKAKPNARARSVVLCQAESTAPGAKKVCKTRGKWIREGRDPLGVY